jgi:hypothetical protein
VVWVQCGGQPADAVGSPPSPVLGAFDVRNLASSGTLSYGSPALGGGKASPKDTLRTVAPGRLPTAAHPTPNAVGGGAKRTGKASVPSFVVSTFSRSVCAVSTVHLVY